MMKIDRNNYEPYFIDYFEGTLDEKLVDDFLEFLQQNPDLKKELSLFNSVNVEPEEVKFTKKDLLFKEKFDVEKEFNKAAIAQMEGDISVSEKKKFENYIQNHPEKEKDIALFQATKLIPDETVIFNKKNKIFRYSVGRTVMNWSIRIAAILILVFTFYVLINNSSNDVIPENQVAKVEDKTPTKEIQAKVIQTPEKQEKKTIEKGEKSSPAPVIKETIPLQIQKKSAREKDRVNDETVFASIRTPVEVPEEMKTLTASLDVPSAHASLGTMYIIIYDESQTDEEHFLADIVIEKTGLDKLNLNKITKAGLNLVTSISNEKFQYHTNSKGKITEYNYDSRLLAFTIPVRNKSDQK